MFKGVLCHVVYSYSQAHVLARRYPGRLKELQSEFDAIATRDHVGPLSASTVSRLPSSNRPYPLNGRNEITLYSGPQRYPRGAFPDITNRSWTIAAKLKLSAPDDHGVIVAQGGDRKSTRLNSSH